MRQRFLNNTVDNNFSLACSLLCGSMLGHPTVEEANEELLYACFMVKSNRMTQSADWLPAKSLYNARTCYAPSLPGSSRRSQVGC